MRIPAICAALAVSSAVIVAPGVAQADGTLQAGTDNANGCYVPERVAHRLGGGEGDKPYFYENSWKAYDRSLAAGVTIFETDVRWTSDGVPILMHDATVDRTTNGTGKVSELTIAQIDALDLDNGAGKVPHFEAFLQRAKQDNVQVWPEYKPEDSNEAWVTSYASLIQSTGVDAVVPSFKKPELAAFKTLLANNKQIWFHSVVADGFSVKPSDVPAGAYAGLINIMVTKAGIMKSMDDANIGVYAWYNEAIPSENDQGWSDVAKFKPLGIITDYPERYQAWGDATGYCLSQKAKCAKLPKKLPGDSQVVLLKKTCTTNQGATVAVKVKGKGKLVKGNKGKVSVKTDAKGKVTITYSAKAKGAYPAWQQSKAYKLK